MKIRNFKVMFSHPVITSRNKDFLNETLEVFYSDKQIGDSIKIAIKMELKSKFIHTQLKLGNVEVVYHIEQKGGMYRRIENKGKDLSSSIIIPLKDLKPFKSLQIFPCIVAKNDFVLDSIEGLNHLYEYKKSKFIFKKGFILAYDTTITLPLTGHFEMGSIVKVKPNKSLFNSISIDFSDPNLIIIEISEILEMRYRSIPKGNILRNSFILEMALIRAVEIIKESPSIYSEGLVYDVLNALFLRNSDNTIIESNKSSAEVVNEIFNYHHIWEKVYDSIDNVVNPHV